MPVSLLGQAAELDGHDKGNDILFLRAGDLEGRCRKILLHHEQRGDQKMCVLGDAMKRMKSEALDYLKTQLAALDSNFRDLLAEDVPKAEAISRLTPHLQDIALRAIELQGVQLDSEVKTVPEAKAHCYTHDCDCFVHPHRQRSMWDFWTIAVVTLVGLVFDYSGVAASRAPSSKAKSLLDWCWSCCWLDRLPCHLVGRFVRPARLELHALRGRASGTRRAGFTTAYWW